MRTLLFALVLIGLASSPALADGMQCKCNGDSGSATGCGRSSSSAAAAVSSSLCLLGLAVGRRRR